MANGVMRSMQRATLLPASIVITSEVSGEIPDYFAPRMTW
jgi:hypothetical protein